MLKLKTNKNKKRYSNFKVMNLHSSSPTIILLLGVLFGIIFWLLETVIHADIFNGGSFIAELWPADSNELWLRFLIFCLFIFFSAVISKIITLTMKYKLKSDIAGITFQFMTESIVITDKYNDIIHINPSFSEVTGYTYEEVIGKNPAMLGSGQQKKEFYENLFSILYKEDHWEGEIWNRTKSGETYPEWLSINLVRDSRGKVVYHIGVFTDITLRKESEERFKHYAFYDPLTDLPNRRFFVERLSQTLKQAKREKKIIAIMFIDIDHFKKINDTKGHEFGDHYLCKFSQEVSNKLRDVDTLARFGGDEFVVLLSFINNEENACDIANKILSIEHICVKSVSVKVSCSIGIAVYPYDGTTVESLIKNADKAMYKVKQTQRGKSQRWL